MTCSAFSMATKPRSMESTTVTKSNIPIFEANQSIKTSLERYRIVLGRTEATVNQAQLVVGGIEQATGAVTAARERQAGKTPGKVDYKAVVAA